MKLQPRYDGPSIISIEGTPDDQLAPVTRQRRRLAAMVAALSDEDWNAPSRCEHWTVQDVIAHLVGVNAYWQASVTAGLAGAPTRVLANFDPAQTPSLMVEPMRALTPAEVLGQFVSTNDAFLGALAELDEEGWSTLAETPAGHVSIRLLAQHALWDSWIHERDIALPLGITTTEEPDEVLSCLRYAAVLGPAFGVSYGKPPVGVFAVETNDPESSLVVEVGESVALRDGSAPPDAPCLRGDAVDLVETLSLRTPVSPSAPAEWQTLLEGLATAFDTELELT